MTIRPHKSSMVDGKHWYGCRNIVMRNPKGSNSCS